MTSKQQRRARVYIRAALVMERGEQNYCCLALAQVSPKDSLPCAIMQNWFYTDEEQLVGAWMTSSHDDCRAEWNILGSERHSRRILALCFMAALVEAGDA